MQLTPCFAMRAPGDILPSKDAEELIDFTCASPWERLALDIELELRAWGLSNGRLPVTPILPTARHVSRPSTSIISPTPIASSTLSLSNTILRLELRHAASNDWLHSHPLERLFDISTCLILTSDSPDGVVADDASDAAILLSALCVAASSCACKIPLLVPVGRPGSLRFVGRQLAPSHKRFSCDYTHSPSSDHSHLAGLLALFRNKRTSARRITSIRSSSAHIAGHFMYDWADFSFKLTPTTDTFASHGRLAAAQATVLTEADPVRRIRISAVWDRFPASDLQRNETLAAMPASTASRLRLSPSSDLLQILSGGPVPATRVPMTLPARLNLQLANRAANGRAYSNPAAPLPLIDISKSLAPTRLRRDRASSVTAPVPRLEGSSPRVAPAPISTALDEYLVQVGEHVAGAAIQDDRIDEEYLTSAVAALFEMDIGSGIMVDVVDALGPNAAEMSLTERVARLVGSSETLGAAQKLWNLFLDGVEVHWEMQWLIAGVPFSLENGPDHNESLVLQKLQMINCCVERIRREKVGMGVVVDSADLDGRGRKSVIEGVELIGIGDKENKIETRVWEPYVQPHPLVTRDMVEEELERMVMRAENSDRSDDMEAKRQSLTLKSDMMAFKAANPESCLADFVRWFSPSDWVEDDDQMDNTNVGYTELLEKGSDKQQDEAQEEEEDKRTNYEKAKIHAQTFNQAEEKSHRSKGHLSARMSREGNIWEELWNSAERLSASEQIPLFDAAAHGNKALADLRTMCLPDVLVHLSMLSASSAASLLHSAFQRPPELPRVESVMDRARQAVRELCASMGLSMRSGGPGLSEVASMVETVAVAEHTALIASSVLSKLPPSDGMGAIVDQLAVGDFVDVVGEREKALVIRMAGLDGGWRNVLLPEWREFVLDGEDGDRMYARLSEEEFRVAFRLGLDYSL